MEWAMVNLQQPMIVWIVAILVIMIISLLIFWLRRHYKIGKITLKTGPVEAELERKDNKGRSPKSQVTTPESSPIQRTQEMIRSEKGEQSMHGSVEIQNQKMKDSPGGKQKMD
jgi:hypothetical protein